MSADNCATTLHKESKRKALPAPALSELAKYPRALTVPQVAVLLNAHPLTIYRWVREQRLPAFVIGTAVRLSPQKLAAWLAERGA